MILQDYTSDTEFDEEAHRMPSLTPALHGVDSKEKDDQEPVKIAPKPQTVPQPKVFHNNLQIPVQGVRSANGATPTIPFPLLILNGLPNAAAINGVQNGQNPLKKDALGVNGGLGLNQQDASSILKSLLDVQKENLEIEKQRLELEKQKLEFERLVGTQLLTLLPMFGGLLQRLAFPNHTEGHSSDTDSPPKKNGRKRPCSDSGLDILKDSKILRNVLEQGIKKYMLGESGNDSDKEDRGVQNEDSNSSSK